MKIKALAILYFVFAWASTANGFVEHVRLADGTSQTLYEIEIPQGISPEQIDSVTISLNGNPLPFVRDDFDLWGFGSFLEGYLWVPGKPGLGNYTFIISAGGVQVTTHDTQSVIRNIPNADVSTFSMQGNTFSWGAISLPGTPLYYRLVIDNDLTGNRVYNSNRMLNMLSHTVPSDILVPGQTYRYHIRVSDSADWIAEQNRSNSHYVKFQYMGGITGMSVQNRKWGDGTSANRIVFQLKDGVGANVTGSLLSPDITIHDPNGHQVNITELELPALSIVRYDAAAGGWNYPVLSFDPWANVYFSDPLIQGIYSIEVTHNGLTYRGTASFNGTANLPIVDPSTFTLSDEGAGGLIWSWQITGITCSGGATIRMLIVVYKQTQVLGHFYFVGPSGQCVDSLPLPASFVETLNAMGDSFTLRVEIRTGDNNNSTMSLPMTLTRVAPQALAGIQGKITDAVTGEPLQGATLALTPGTITLTSQTDGTFSSSGIPEATYSAQVSAVNYDPKTLPGIMLASGAPNQLNISLTPYAPKVTSGAAVPSVVGNDGQRTALLTVRVTHPLGLSSIDTVLADLAPIGGAPEQIFYDSATHGDLTAGDGTYSYRATIAKGTKAKLYGLNVTAVDMAGKNGFGSISLNVTDKLSGTVQPSQSVSQSFDNDLGGQTLNIHFDFMKTVSSLKAVKADCEILLTIHGPDGSEYGPYTVADSIDIPIPNAPAGQWEYETLNQCTSALSYEIETSGSGTGLLVGRVLDGLTGAGVKGANIQSNTGGATVSLDQGYYSGVAVAGTGIVTTAKTGYKTNVKNGVHVSAGATTNLNIQVVPENGSAQPAPSGIHIFNILDPGEDPTPPTQPFAAKVSGTNLEFNAIVPKYQQPVDIYLGLTINDSAHAGRLYLLNESDALVEFTNSLLPWRRAATQEDSAQLLEAISGAYPMGSYTLYSLATTDSSTLTDYDLSFFTTTLAQPAPVGQNASYIPNPAEEPDPLTQPLAVKVTDGNLILDAHFPLQKEAVTIFLAFTTPSGQLVLIKPDGSREVFTDTLWPWREKVTAEVSEQVFSLPTSQLTPGVHYFYSLVTTDPDGLSNYDLVYFSMNVTQ